MSYIWSTFIYNPIFNLLVWLYNVIPGHDLGVAIILLTIAIRFVLYPLTRATLKSQKALQEIQPKVKALQEEYKDNKEVLSVKLMELYKAEKVNPFSSCLPLLIQLPLMIAVYQVFRHGLNSEGFDKLYSFVANPDHINTVSMYGLLDLGQRSIVLAVAAGLVQFLQTHMMTRNKPATIDNKEIPGSHDEKMLSLMNKQMTIMMPVMTVIVGLSLPSGLSLYWFVSTLFMFVQQIFVLKTHKKA